MRKFLILTTLFVISTISTIAETIVVYGPDSMKWIEPVLQEDFKKKTGDTIKFVGIKGLITRMNLEKSNPKSDVVIGLTGINIEEGKKLLLLEKFRPENSKYIAKPDYILDEEWYSTPFDYGVMGINYNKKSIKNPPKTFEELFSLKKQILVQDPRSSTGQEILLWSIAVYGDKWKEFWKNLKPAILTVTSDWDDSFAKFSVGEAPMMMGYGTSEAFFYTEDSSSLYSSFIPENGGYIYLEGVSLTKKKEIKNGSKRFIEYLLEAETQEKIMNNNYMLPVREIPIPKNYQAIPTPNKLVKINAKDAFENLERWKKELVEILKND